RELRVGKELLELLHARADVEAVVLIAPTEERRLRDLRRERKERRRHLLEAEVAVHSQVAFAIDLFEVQERVLERLLPAGPFGVIPEARLKSQRGPEDPAPREHSHEVRPDRMRLPRAGGRPCSELREALRLARAETKREVAAEASARDVRLFDFQVIE